MQHVTQCNRSHSCCTVSMHCISLKLLKITASPTKKISVGGGGPLRYKFAKGRQAGGLLRWCMPWQGPAPVARGPCRPKACTGSAQGKFCLPHCWCGAHRDVANRDTPGTHPPPKSGPWHMPISGPAAGGPPGPPGVLFGGHKGQFGSWGAPQSVVASFHKLQLIVVHVYSKYFKADIQI